MSRAVAVVVGVLLNDAGEVLLCQRPEGKAYALQWEFPGGKVESGETGPAALARELREELAVEADVGRLLHSAEAFYRDGGTFAVEYYQVGTWRGAPRNQAFAQFRWVAPATLLEYDVLEGNREFCALLAGGIHTRP